MAHFPFIPIVEEMLLKVKPDVEKWTQLVTW